jgi:phosphoglycerate dehydrogenase-like enzyme
MRRFQVVASGDFLRPDGARAYPEFDFGPLESDPRIDFRFLTASDVIAPDQIASADALVLSGSRITAGSFHKDGRLALIAQFGAGFDHIDLAAATAHGVAVTNTPLGVRRPVAVSILTLIFALTTRLITKARLVGQGSAGWAEITQHNGVGLTGKTLGSIGIGNIGTELFRLAAPLGMRFLAHDPQGLAAVAGELGVEMVALDELFSRSDILCVNCPLTPATRHLVDAKRLALMKPTAYLINTARGGIVDQQALTRVLAAGQIAGAGLDVFEREPLDPSDPILKLDNVLLTPHSLCWTDELYAGCGRDAVTSVMETLEGRPLVHLLNPEIRHQKSWMNKLERYRAGHSPGESGRDIRGA